MDFREVRAVEDRREMAFWSDDGPEGGGGIPMVIVVVMMEMMC